MQYPGCRRDVPTADVQVPDAGSSGIGYAQQMRLPRWSAALPVLHAEACHVPGGAYNTGML
jgi:hypothetical protein